jgi:hypothetical protein
LDEQQTASHSPIEQEYRERQPGLPSASDNFSRFGYSLGVVVAAVFILYMAFAAIVLVVS